MNTHRHDIHFVVPEYMGNNWVSKTTVTTYLWVYWEWGNPQSTIYIYIKDWGLWETFHHGVSLVFWLSDGEYTMGKYVGNARHCHFRLEVRSFLLSHILFRCLHPLLPVPSPFFLVKFANDICSACSVFVDPTVCSLLLLYVTRKELTP